jgi:hypothetical protein
MDTGDEGRESLPTVAREPKARPSCGREKKKKKKKLIDLEPASG